MTAAQRRKPGRQTGRQSSLLENCVGALHLIGFRCYDSLGEFEKASSTGDRYVIRNYPHASLYGTGGKKEALIVAPASDGFIEEEGGEVRIIVEAKYQESSGSVDEKLPYIWHALLVSEVPNWVVILDGKYWKTNRGKAAVLWLKGHDSPEGRRLRVTDQRGFIEMARSLWNAS